MTEHSLLSPSGAHRWAICAASVWLEKDIPDTENAASIEGTKAHEVAANLLKAELYHSFDKSVINDDDINPYIMKYVNYVLSMESGDEAEIEIKVDYSNYMPKNNENYTGTADCIVEGFYNGVNDLHIIDFKYGFGKVEAKENYQLLLYALGAINIADNKMIDTITLHIVQPRINHFDKWTITRDELMIWGGFFKARAIEVFKPNPSYTPDEKACKYCKAKATCPALLGVYKTALETMEFEGSKSFDQIRYVLDNAGLLKFYISLMENGAIGTLESGGVVEGYKLGKGRSFKKLKEGAEETLYAEYGDEIYKKSVLAYGQIKDLISLEHLELFETIEGKTTLIKDK
jgi:hypothetical protein